MLADETSPHPVITAIKEAFNHPSIPYYLVIPPEGPVRPLDGAVIPSQFLKLMQDL